MASNLSFTQQGALPLKTQTSTPATLGVTSFSSALNKAQGIPTRPAGISSDGMALQPPPISGQPAIKSHTVTDAAGNTITQTYHKPEVPKTGTTKGLLASTLANNDGSNASKNNPNYGFQTQGLGTAGNPGGNTTSGVLSSNQNSSTPTTPIVDNPTTFTSSQPSTMFNQANTGLLNIGTNGSSSYDAAVQKLADFNRELAKKNAAIESEPIPLEFQQGKEQVIGRQAAVEQNTLQNAVNQELAQEQAQTGALGTVTGATAPRQNGYVLIDPTTGQPIGGNGISAINQGAQYDAQYQGALANATDNQAIAGAKNNIDSITQLINKGNLNPSTVNLANATIQEIQNNLSSSDYATLTNVLGSINAALTKVTGSPVDIAKLSTQNGTSLLATINNEVAAAQGIAAGKLTGNNNKPNGTTTSTSSGGLYDF